MRDAFHDDLDKITDQLVEMTRLAGSAVSRATTALLDADVHLAESVIAADDELDAIRSELDALSIDLLARQQPVATDLRIVVTSMRMSSDLERMGDLARHIAKVARLRYPESAVPAALSAHILQMGQVAERIVAKAGSVIASKDTRHRPQPGEGRRRHGRAAPAAVRGDPVATRPTSPGRRSSTSPCSAATTSGSPTTPSPWRSASSTSSPGEYDLPELDHEDQEDERVAL